MFSSCLSLEAALPCLAMVDSSTTVKDEISCLGRDMFVSTAFVAAAAEEAARSAASKQARGWQTAQPNPQQTLPEPDLVALRLSTLKQLLLEAAALGCMLWETEKAVQDTGYLLVQRHLQPADLSAD